jgi:hypothetical protein
MEMLNARLELERNMWKFCNLRRPHQNNNHKNLYPQLAMGYHSMIQHQITYTLYEY